MNCSYQTRFQGRRRMCVLEKGHTGPHEFSIKVKREGYKTVNEPKKVSKKK